VLTAQDEAELRRLNAVDVGLFQAVMAGWTPIRDELCTYLAGHRRREGGSEGEDVLF
jgi:hypothetical protein